MRRMSKLDRALLHAQKMIEQRQMSLEGKVPFAVGWMVGYEVGMREAARRARKRAGSGR